MRSPRRLRRPSPGAIRGAFRGAFLGLLGLALAACATPPAATVVDLTIDAAGDLNPNADGRASPAVVRVYYLVAPTAFQEADFFKLFEQEGATLGADLAARDEFTMLPGASKTLTRELRADVRHLGVVAVYRDIAKAAWRDVIAVPPNQTTPVHADVGALAVALSVGAAK